MRNIHYKQSKYGQLTTADALQVVDSLEVDGESAEYINLMVDEIVVAMKELGSDNFGPVQAKEVLAVMIATGRFIPEIH